MSLTASVPGEQVGAAALGLREAEAAGARVYRVANIDMIRGLVIVIMAIDHVRDYVMVGAAQDPMADPNIGAALFFTRWITHFCAPVFVFLAGTSAGLMAARKSPSDLGVFLLKRGAWLIVVEWFVIATAFTFAPWGIAQIGGLVAVPMQVIWAIGASMVVLALAQFAGARACAVIGGAILLGHNLVDPLWPVTNGPFDTAHPLWVALHAQMGVAVGPFFFGFAYPLLPWIGVMLLGFGVAGVFQRPPGTRDRQLLTWGMAATAAFLVLRAADLYGDPNPWLVQGSAIGTTLDFLNVTKYPPSLLFLLMTLGPAAIACAGADRVPDIVKQPLVTFGKVPFAFYVAHFYLIHTISIVLGTLQGFRPEQFLTIMFFFPEGYGVGLPGVYAVWLLVIAALYPFCRWVAAVKARRRDWWLSYV
jgi:uncharacterized membrane protein